MELISQCGLTEVIFQIAMIVGIIYLIAIGTRILLKKDGADNG